MTWFAGDEKKKNKEGVKERKREEKTKKINETNSRVTPVKNFPVLRLASETSLLKRSVQQRCRNTHMAHAYGRPFARNPASLKQSGKFLDATQAFLIRVEDSIPWHVECVWNMARRNPGKEVGLLAAKHGLKPGVQ